MNSETEKIIEERFTQLPNTLSDFVANKDWRSTVNRIGEQSGISEEKLLKLRNEVFMVLLCFENWQDLKKNIVDNLLIEDSTARKITDSINGSILGSVMKEIKSVWAEIQKEPTEVKSYDSFEQTILRQAQAMRPIGERIMNQEASIKNGTEEQQRRELPKQYVGNNDPYRESIE
ncbi:MAG TPA: hypothetical protein VJH67_02100 [Candidatus Paceibacterota bacterium]